MNAGWSAVHWLRGGFPEAERHKLEVDRCICPLYPRTANNVIRVVQES